MSDLGHQTSEELDRWLVELAYGEASSVPAEARARIESDPQLSSELAALREARSLAAMPLEEPSAAMDDAILAAADDFLATLSDAPTMPDAIDAAPATLPPPINLAAERAARRAAPPASPAPSDSKLLTPAPPAWMRFLRPLSLAASIAFVVGGSWMLLQNRETAMDRAPAAPAAAPVPAPVAAVPSSPEVEERAAKEDATRAVALAEAAGEKKKAAESDQRKAEADALFKSAMVEGEARSGTLDGLGRGGGGIGGLGLSGAGTGGGAGYGTGSIGPVGKQAAAKKDVAIQAPAKAVAPELLAADKDAYVSRGASPDDEAVDEAKFKTVREEAPSAAPPPPPPAPAPTPAPRSPVVALADAPVPVNQAPPTLQPAPREALSDRLKVVTKSALESPKPAAASAAVESRDATVVTQASASSLIATGRSHLLARRYTQAVGAFRSARKSLESQASFASDTLWQDAAAGEIDALLALGYDAEADRLAEQLARVAPDRVNLQRGVRRSRQYDFNEGSGNSAPAMDAPLTK